MVMSLSQIVTSCDVIEATITKLRNQIKELESSIETKAAAKAAEIEHQLTESFREKEKNLENTVLVSKQKLEESLSNNSILQSALEATQLELFELKTKLDDESSAKGAELDILMTDLDRANQRALTAEKRLEKYHEESQSMTSHIPQKTMVDTTSLELELQAKDRELVNVRGDVERLQRNVKSISESSTSRIESLEEQLAAQSLRVKELEKIMQEQSDYHEIKKELNILRTVEFSSSTSEVTSTTLSKPLEVLLLEKNKGLVSENTGLKTELAELRSHFATLQTECNESHQTIFDQRSLISRLESDLANIRPFLPPRTEAEGQSSSTNIISEAVKDITTDGDDKASHDSDSLLNIVTNQRERFKVLNQQLESECLEQRQTIGLLQKEMDTLRTDNVNMYEKIRFLQSYQGVGNRGVDDTSTRRYSNQYEAKLDPFTAFSVKERQRKYQQLSGPDKATLILGRFILSNKVARLATLVYLIAVHLIIVLVRLVFYYLIVVYLITYIIIIRWL
jgi:homeobox protein cut-like